MTDAYEPTLGDSMVNYWRERALISEAKAQRLRAEVERLQAIILSLQSDDDIARISELGAEMDRLQAIESALIDFLDALVIAKRNDDVMSVVDAMLAVHVEAEINRAEEP